MFKRLLLLAVPAGILSMTLAACGSGDEDVPATVAPAVTEPAPSGPPPGDEGVVVVISQDPGGPGGKYAFSPANLTFKMGQTVTLRLESESEFHTFTVSDLGINEAMNPGQTKDFTFKFNEAGTFRLHCIPHETNGMVGQIVVEP